MAQKETCPAGKECQDCKNCRSSEQMALRVKANFEAGIIPERLSNPSSIVLHRGYGI